MSLFPLSAASPQAHPTPVDLFLQPVLFLGQRDGPVDFSLVGLEGSSQGTQQDNGDAGRC